MNETIKMSFKKMKLVPIVDDEIIGKTLTEETNKESDINDQNNASDVHSKIIKSNLDEETKFDLIKKLKLNNGEEFLDQDKIIDISEKLLRPPRKQKTKTAIKKSNMKVKVDRSDPFLLNSDLLKKIQWKTY